MDSSVGKMGKGGFEPEDTGAGENCRFFEQMIFSSQNSDLSGFQAFCAVAGNEWLVGCGYIQVFSWRCAYPSVSTGESKFFLPRKGSFPQPAARCRCICPQKLWDVLWIRWAKVARSPYPRGLEKTVRFLNSRLLFHENSELFT